jgi:TolA-binding protein
VTTWPINALSIFICLSVGVSSLAQTNGDIYPGRDQAGEVLKPPLAPSQPDKSRKEPKPPPDSSPSPSSEETANKDEPSVSSGPIQAGGGTPKLSHEPKGDVPAAAPPSVEQLYQAARRAFWSGRFEMAEQYYWQIIDITPNSHQAHGELGNVLLTQGKNREAADSYYKAAILLLDEGRQPQANHLLRVIERLNPQGAEELKQWFARLK